MSPRSVKKRIARSERRTPLAESVPKQGKSGRGRTPASTTPLVIRARGVDFNDDARDHARERAGFAIGKFALYVQRAVMHVDNISGPTGSPTIGCRIVLTTAGLGPITSEARRSSATTAIDAALKSVERALRRTIERVESRKTRR
jgi:ribosome-associated translation inhibitor RaiA